MNNKPESELFSFGEWVQRRRKSLDLTQKELAARVGISPVTITKIERDERRPSRQVAVLLADALSVGGQDLNTFLQAARGIKSAFRLPQPAAVDNSLSLGEEKTTNPVFTISPLPLPLTPLVGREPELQHLITLFSGEDCRLVTLTGPGGVGKTRLALQTAFNLSNNFRDGVVFVPLAPVTTPDYIPAATSAALGIDLAGRSISGHSPADVLLEILKPASLLVVFDNLEHLLAGEGFSWVAHLLATAPGVRLLATSRERLNLSGEWVFEVSGLPVPENRSPVALSQSSAATLFLQAARRVSPAFEPDARDWQAIARICSLVDGLPLALELAASWVRALPPEEIAAEIERSMDFLSAQVRNLPERHRSLRAVFEHSWLLLEPAEQSFLRRLSVFRGGFTRQAAESVTGASLRTMSALIDKSLLHRESGARFDIHELVRQYAAEQLKAAGEMQLARDAHLDFYYHLAEDYSRKITTPGNDSSSLMETELDNFREALDWSLIGGRVDAGLQLAWWVWRFWMLRGMLQEGSNWMDRLLASSDEVATEVRARGYMTHAALKRNQGEYDTARELLFSALALSRQSGDKFSTAATLNELGLMALERQQFAQAADLFAESLDLMRAAANQNGEAVVLYNLGRAYLHLERLEEAQDILHTGYRLAEMLKDGRIMGYTLHGLGLVADQQGDISRAAQYFMEGLLHSRNIGDRAMSVWGLEQIGAVSLQLGHQIRAARLFAAADALRSVLNIAIPPSYQAGYDASLQKLKNSLSPDDFEANWEIGRGLSYDEVLDLALSAPE